MSERRFGGDGAPVCVWTERAALTGPVVSSAAKAAPVAKRDRKLERATFRQVMGRDPRDDGELEQFLTVQAKKQNARLVSAMVEGGNSRRADIAAQRGAKLR